MEPDAQLGSWDPAGLAPAGEGDASAGADRSSLALAGEAGALAGEGRPPLADVG
jgi:hypothetical protein